RGEDRGELVDGDAGARPVGRGQVRPVAGDAVRAVVAEVEPVVGAGAGPVARARRDARLRWGGGGWRVDAGRGEGDHGAQGGEVDRSDAWHVVPPWVRPPGAAASSAPCRSSGSPRAGASGKPLNFGCSRARSAIGRSAGSVGRRLGLCEAGGELGAV